MKFKLTASGTPFNHVHNKLNMKLYMTEYVDIFKGLGAEVIEEVTDTGINYFVDIPTIEILKEVAEILHCPLITFPNGELEIYDSLRE